MLATSGGQGGGRPLAGRGVSPLNLFLSGGWGKNRELNGPGECKFEFATCQEEMIE
jgi:hypothetical protein